MDLGGVVCVWFPEEEQLASSEPVEENWRGERKVLQRRRERKKGERAKLFFFPSFSFFFSSREKKEEIWYNHS